MRRAALDRQAATDCGGWRDGHNGGERGAGPLPDALPGRSIVISSCQYFYGELFTRAGGDDRVRRLSVGTRPNTQRRSVPGAMSRFSHIPLPRPILTRMPSVHY